MFRSFALTTSFVLTSLLPAQIGFATVTTAKQGERVDGAMPYQHAVTQAADQRWYVLVRRNVPNGQPVNDLELWGSDNGRQWQMVTSVPTDDEGLGCLVAEPQRPRLHMLWNAKPDGKFASVFFATFDLETGKWTGKPQCLAKATGSNDQYFANDFCFVGDKLVAAIGAHRSPKTNGYSAWCSCLRVLSDLDSSKWSAPASVSNGSAGIGANLAGYGDTLHMAFRTYSGNDHCIATRRWHAGASKFLENVVRVAPLAGETRRHTNNGLVAIDQLGHRYVFTAIGTTKHTEGRLVVSHAKGDAKKWACFDVDDDPKIRGGNTNIPHIALARGPGNQMLAFYSKLTEDYRNLYMQILDQGRPIGKPRQIEAGLPGAFERLSGVRDSTKRVGVQLVVTSGAAARKGNENAKNQVRVYGLLR